MYKTVFPDPDDSDLTSDIFALNQDGDNVFVSAIEEKPLTIFLNSTEVITVMTIRDYPEFLAMGYLLNQAIIYRDSKDVSVEYDEETETVVVRAPSVTSFEDKMKKKTQTSGCSVGTVYGSVMEEFNRIQLSCGTVRVSYLVDLMKQLSLVPTLYLKSGAIHGCALCSKDTIEVFMEDIGRHNAVDKIAGFMLSNDLSPDEKIFYTTGRLTSEMVIKAAMMKIPVLVSRSGFTAWAARLASQVGMTMISRMRGRKFLCVSGGERLLFDVDF